MDKASHLTAKQMHAGKGSQAVQNLKLSMQGYLVILTCSVVA